MTTPVGTDDKVVKGTVKHVCKERDWCCCSVQGLAPSQDCPIHGYPWPPRCAVCGRLMPWPKVECDRELTSNVDIDRSATGEYECRYCGATIDVDGGRHEPECVTAASIALLTALRAELARLRKVEEAARTVTLNAEIQPDARMGGITDTYTVPLNDIDALRAALNSNPEAPHDARAKP